MGRIHINIRKNAERLCESEYGTVILNWVWVRAIQGMCDEITRLENKCIELGAGVKAQRRWKDLAYKRNREIVEELRDVRTKNASLRKSNDSLLRRRARIISVVMGR